MKTLPVSDSTPTPISPGQLAVALCVPALCRDVLRLRAELAHAERDLAAAVAALEAA